MSGSREDSSSSPSSPPTPAQPAQPESTSPSPPPPRRPSGHPYVFPGLSQKGLPGVNQTPHKDDKRPLARKRIEGAFQTPEMSNLTPDEQEEVENLYTSRKYPRKGPSASGWPLESHINRPNAAEGQADGRDGREDGEDIVMGDDTPEERGRSPGDNSQSLPDDQKPPMPPPTDPKAAGHGKGTAFGNRMRRPGSHGRDTPKYQARRDLENPNRRWEIPNLLEQQAKLIEREKTCPSKHRYRYICPEAGCGVSANDAREISRHYNWSKPPMHPGRQHIPSRTLQHVLYKDWLRDEGLHATRYATSDEEFYEELAKEVPDLERQKYRSESSATVGEQQQEEEEEEEEWEEEEEEEEEGQHDDDSNVE